MQAAKLDISALKPNIFVYMLSWEMRFTWVLLLHATTRTSYIRGSL